LRNLLNKSEMKEGIYIYDYFKFSFIKTFCKIIFHKLIIIFKKQRKKDKFTFISFII
jgi:hypothetical protein